MSQGNTRYTINGKSYEIDLTAADTNAAAARLAAEQLRDAIDDHVQFGCDFESSLDFETIPVEGWACAAVADDHLRTLSAMMHAYRQGRIDEEELSHAGADANDCSDKTIMGLVEVPDTEPIARAYYQAEIIGSDRHRQIREVVREAMQAAGWDVELGGADEEIADHYVSSLEVQDHSTPPCVFAESDRTEVCYLLATESGEPAWLEFGSDHTGEPGASPATIKPGDALAQTLRLLNISGRAFADALADAPSGIDVRAAPAPAALTDAAHAAYHKWQALIAETPFDPSRPQVISARMLCELLSAVRPGDVLCVATHCAMGDILESRQITPDFPAFDGNALITLMNPKSLAPCSRTVTPLCPAKAIPLARFPGELRATDGAVRAIQDPADDDAWGAELTNYSGPMPAPATASGP